MNDEGFVDLCCSFRDTGGDHIEEAIDQSNLSRQGGLDVLERDLVVLLEVIEDSLCDVFSILDRD